MGKQDEKLINKIESRPFRHDITYSELERYYRLHGFLPEHQNGTSHVQFKNDAGIRVTVKKRQSCQSQLVKQAVKLVHNDD